jgi:hypothetical protein
LQHQEFFRRTDQKSLVHLEEQRLTTVWQQKAFTNLLGLQYRNCYRKGQENRAADALTRRQHSESVSLNTTTECQPAWLEEVRASYNANTNAGQWIQKLKQGPDPKGRFTWQDNLLYFR